MRHELSTVKLYFDSGKIVTYVSGMKTAKYHHGNLRAELLQQAELELENGGIENLSLRKVARRAGVSHTAFAHHFGDARGLLTALAASGFEQFGRELAHARQSALENGEDLLVVSGVAYVDFAIAHPQLFTLMFASQSPDFSDGGLDAASMNAFSSFLQDVRHDEWAAAPPEGQVDVAAMSNWAKVHGLATLLMTGRMRSVLALDGDQRKQAVMDIVRHD